ncbi:hypothetical protein [Slackia piriformis]|uniref:hypothetical protein n=1 Tax=Slackia piriformis TaxID=626934 RepID=UPI0026DA9A49|nr:hypothetical protein [Slackia piriformis]MDO5024460.1 hypothetical protein [Slackia piriformis]
MRLFLQFAEGIRRSMDYGKHDPNEASESLEDAISRALDMDADVMLGLEAESLASIVHISGTDPRVVEYVVRSLALEAFYLEQAGRTGKSDLRYAQACALARAYGVEEPERSRVFTEEELAGMLEEDGVVESSSR